MLGLDGMYTSVPRFDDPQLAVRSVLAWRTAAVFPKGTVADVQGQHRGGYVLGHEEGVATAGDAAANCGDFAQRDEPFAESPHDIEIDIGGADISAPLTGAVASRFRAENARRDGYCW